MLSMDFFSVSDVQSLPKTKAPLSLMIGNFDGVHRGHQQLILQSTKWASKQGGISVALTFHPHPLAVLAPRPGYSRLFSLQDRAEQLHKHGTNGMFVQRFSHEFAAMTADDFMTQYLQAHFHPQHIVVGEDFGFGQGRSGNVVKLQTFCRKNGIELQPIPAFKIDVGPGDPPEVVSSSSIRQALRDGDVEKAKLFLGRPFYLRGSVAKGDQRGRLIGFPTANLAVVEEQIPRLGVYATKTWLAGKAYASVTNVGIHPTFKTQENPPVKVETHLLGFSEDIYEKEIRVEFYHYLRMEQKFSGIDELSRQIQIDIQMAKEKEL
jgi:riboflavin kinase/FMN adenylyltransferase